MATSRKALETSGKKTVKPAGHEQVVEFISNLDHPLKDEIAAVRNIILKANDQLTEHIKWNAPSFCFKGDDRVTFNLHGKGFFRLIFHRGAKVKDKVGGPLFDDATGLLEWVTGDRATVKITSMDDVKAKRDKLAALVNTWIEATGS